jgi:hypothetical protein
MADEVKTRPELEASFTTGVEGGITAQTMRNLLASVPLTAELPNLDAGSLSAPNDILTTEAEVKSNSLF